MPIKKFLPVVIMFLLVPISIAASSLAQTGIQTDIQNCVNVINNRGSSGQERWQALSKLMNYGASAVPALRSLLTNTDPNILIPTVKAIGYIGKDAAAAVPELIDALKNTNPLVKQAVCEALGQIAPTNPSVINALISAFSQGNQQIKLAAAFALGNGGQAAKAAAPRLTEALRHDSDPQVRASAASALGKIGPVNPDIIPVLRGALKDANALVQQNAASALGTSALMPRLRFLI